MRGRMKGAHVIHLRLNEEGYYTSVCGDEITAIRYANLIDCRNTTEAIIKSASFRDKVNYIICKDCFEHEDLPLLLLAEV